MKNYLIASLLTVGTLLASEIPNEIRTQITKHAASTSWNALYYDVVQKVIRENKFETMAEVGVALGGHANEILTTTSLKSYVGVDPYHYNYDPADGFVHDVASYSDLDGQKNFDYLHQWVGERLSKFGDRAKLVRKPSVEGSKEFADGSLDCVFIDGDHRYQPVLDDMAAWYPKVRAGGILMGDDYHWKDVAQAVNAFCKKHSLKLEFFTANSGYKIWAIRK